MMLLFLSIQGVLIIRKAPRTVTTPHLRTQLEGYSIGGSMMPASTSTSGLPVR